MSTSSATQASQMQYRSGPSIPHFLHTQTLLHHFTKSDKPITDRHENWVQQLIAIQSRPFDISHVFILELHLDVFDNAISAKRMKHLFLFLNFLSGNIIGWMQISHVKA
ncbi:Uncharacterized protein Fot_50019 [Forsythia ovata]|uniref:Uncharacterized protein n=1 Tax=Forsythia ovata TaxID=205694 RepID=A0ABD1PYJ9_9LAMI